MSAGSVSFRRIPFAPNTMFFGRQDELSQLERSLVTPSGTTLPLMSIIGEGGVGKSQLALRFIYDHLEDFSAVFWVQAETAIKLAQDFEEVAKEVGVTDGNMPISLGLLQEPMKKWFRNTKHRWLLVLDNVESMAICQDYVPTGGRGSILITTRDQTLFQPPITTHLHLKCFTQEQSHLFLSNNLNSSARPVGNTRNQEYTMKIHAACGGLPLALSQVIRYTRALHVSVEEASNLCSTQTAFLDENSELNKLSQPDYFHHISTSRLWEHAISSLTPSALRLVRLLAHFDPDLIQYHLITSVPIPQASSPETVGHTSGYICERGLLAGASPLLRKAEQVAETGIQVLGADPATSPSQSELNVELTKVLSDISNSQGKIHMAMGHFSLAVHKFTAAVKMRQSLALVDTELIYIMRNEASAYVSLNQSQKTLEILQETGQLLDEQFANLHDVSVYQNSQASNLGIMSSAYIALGKFDQAWEAAMKSTELIIQVYGLGSPMVADCYATLGRIKKHQMQLEEAEELLLKALDIQTNVAGCSRDTAAALHHYATILKAKQDYTKALSVMEQAVDMWRKLSEAKNCLARSLYYLSCFQGEGDDPKRSNLRAEAYLLYTEHVGKAQAKEEQKLNYSDFDNMVPHYER
ncbi:hypothetical protein JX265_005215 [Neoarthrinium moseri]|uniref:NB-ARC domain-containing protein n=1 Tax=Neoarthrinium moseri TaxID=1658444 RepID=A0A9P9WPZ1_9PEZI|nr:hypothetical protein JX265_005215 [Neoarthrinium moseri]